MVKSQLHRDRISASLKGRPKTILARRNMSIGQSARQQKVAIERLRLQLADNQPEDPTSESQ
jgi:hypothetical protein